MAVSFRLRQVGCPREHYSVSTVLYLHVQEGVHGKSGMHTQFNRDTQIPMHTPAHTHSLLYRNLVILGFIFLVSIILSWDLLLKSSTRWKQLFF